MGNVLVSLDDEHEAVLRRLAQEKYGSKKGAVSNVVQDALDKTKDISEKEQAKKRLNQLMETGINLGFKGKIYESRDELYD